MVEFKVNFQKGRFEALGLVLQNIFGTKKCMFILETLGLEGRLLLHARGGPN